MSDIVIPRFLNSSIECRDAQFQDTWVLVPGLPHASVNGVASISHQVHLGQFAETLMLLKCGIIVSGVRRFLLQQTLKDKGGRKGQAAETLNALFSEVSGVVTG